MSSLGESASTAAVAPLAPSSPALSAAQLRASLWTHAACAVYGVVMGERVPGLPAMLAQARVGEYDCLLPGALSPAQREAAPYMVRLQAESPFTDWLLFEAAAGLGDWGVLVTSEAPRLQVRTQLRELMQVRLPDGSEIDLAWMDPEILLALLPMLDAAQWQRFMGPVQAIVVAGAAHWTHVERLPGAAPMVLRRTPVLRAA